MSNEQPNIAGIERIKRLLAIMALPEAGREPGRIPASLFDQAQALGIDVAGYVRVCSTPQGLTTQQMPSLLEYLAMWLKMPRTRG